jgi:hypothetical protein
MIGSASTLEKAKIGRVASDALPSGGGKVWKDFMGHLSDDGGFAIRDSVSVTAVER